MTLKPAAEKDDMGPDKRGAKRQAARAMTSLPPGNIMSDEPTWGCGTVIDDGYRNAIKSLAMPLT